MRVLIADDENMIADSLAAIFRTKGIEALAVYSGEHAVQVAESFLPDVLICDVFMNGITGIEVETSFHQILPHCRVLLVSGNTTTVEAYSGADADSYRFDIMTKPVHPKLLLEYVNHCARGESPAAGAQPC